MCRSCRHLRGTCDTSACSSINLSLINKPNPLQITSPPKKHRPKKHRPTIFPQRTDGSPLLPLASSASSQLLNIVFLVAVRRECIIASSSSGVKEPVTHGSMTCRHASSGDVAMILAVMNIYKRQTERQKDRQTDRQKVCWIICNKIFVPTTKQDKNQRAQIYKHTHTATSHKDPATLPTTAPGVLAPLCAQ